MFSDIEEKRASLAFVGTSSIQLTFIPLKPSIVMDRAWGVKSDKTMKCVVRGQTCDVSSERERD